MAIKPENRDPYPPQCWRDLYAVLGIPEPSRSVVMTSTAQVTYPYYNSGVIAVPRARCDQLRESWTKRIFDVLDLYESRPDIVPAKERHWTNQLSLALAVAGDGIPVVRLPVAANLSTTVTVHPLFAHEVTPPFVLHYHNEMDAGGFVYRSRNRALNPLIDAFNRERAELGGLRLRGAARPAVGAATAPLGRGSRLVRTGAGRPRSPSPPAGAAAAPGQAIGAGSGRPMTAPTTTAIAGPPPPDHPVFPFFVGCGRSGTTLLRAMFDAHRDVAVPDEVAFIIRYARPHYALQYGWPRRFDAARCTDLIVGDSSFRRWPITEPEARAALADAIPTSFADTIRQLYALAAARRGKSRYADKTPMHVLHLRRLGRLFPEARFVHVVRDGRDVAMSYRSVGWGPTTVEDAAVRWRRSVLRGRSEGERLGAGRYREVRYEDLVRDPERVLRELCGFLDLEWDDGVLHHHERAADVIAATRFPDAHRRLLLPPTPGLRDWRREMATDDVARFEAVAGGLLDELGYGRSAPRPSVPRRATARCRVAADGAARSWVQVVAGARVVARQVGRR